MERREIFVGTLRTLMVMILDDFFGNAEDAEGYDFDDFLGTLRTLRVMIFLMIFVGTLRTLRVMIFLMIFVGTLRTLRVMIFDDFCWNAEDAEGYDF
jgi:hypothetical protein